MRKARKVFNFLLFSAIFLLFSVFIRPRKEREKIIGFASSQFAGNIKYLYLEMAKYPNVRVLFVSGEKGEIKRVRKLGVDARYYLDVKSTALFLRVHAWVTSHGANYIPFVGLIRRVLPFLKWKHGSKWIDVWHGLGWVHTERGKMLKDYDLAIDTSEYFREYYSGGDSNIATRIKIAGYPRNDPLLDGRWSREEIEKKLSIPNGRKNILYAPTWGHEQEKKLFPWKRTDKLISELEKFCQKNTLNFLIRMHPNWYTQDIKQSRLSEAALKNARWIFHVSPFKYVDTQPLLFISDVLITDWSSIANDFILLNRPVIFLDTQFPVEKHVLTPEDRFGHIIKSKDEFFEKLRLSVTQPNLLEKKRRTILKKMYEYIDGKSSKRCAEEIIDLVS